MVLKPTPNLLKPYGQTYTTSVPEQHSLRPGGQPNLSIVKKERRT